MRRKSLARFPFQALTHKYGITFLICNMIHSMQNVLLLRLDNQRALFIFAANILYALGNLLLPVHKQQ